ncbi:hypothetical protein D3C83_84640 [compost metagenome]
MHGEQLVVRLRIDHPQVRPGELNPHDQRLDPADDEEQQARVQVALPDPLVVDGGEERAESRRLVPRLLQRFDSRRPRCDRGGHQRNAFR